MQNQDIFQKALTGDRAACVAIAHKGTSEQIEALKKANKARRAEQKNQAQQSSEAFHKQQAEKHLAQAKAETMTDQELELAYLSLRVIMHSDNVMYGRIPMKSTNEIAHYKRVFAYRGLAIPASKVDFAA